MRQEKHNFESGLQSFIVLLDSIPIIKRIIGKAADKEQIQALKDYYYDLQRRWDEIHNLHNRSFALSSYFESNERRFAKKLSALKLFAERQ